MPRKTNPTVSLTPEEAKAVYKLYSTCIASDKHYRTCQSTLYRSMVSSTANSKALKDAYESLKAKIDALAPPEEAARDAPIEETAKEAPTEEANEADKEGD